MQCCKAIACRSDPNLLSCSICLLGTAVPYRVYLSASKPVVQMRGKSELAGVLVHFNIAIHGHLLHEARSFRESQMVFS